MHLSAVPPVRVVCALIERRGRLLAARRGPHMAHAGKWELPGGKVHPGETPREALRREIAEEFTVDCRVGSYFGVHRHPYHDFVIVLSGYECTFTGLIRCCEHEKVRWVTPGAAMLLEWTAADIPLVKKWCRRAQPVPARRPGRRSRSNGP